MVVDALSPAESLHESVGGGQLASEVLLGFGVAHALEAADVVDGNDTRATCE